MKRPTEGEAALILIDRAYRAMTDYGTLKIVSAKNNLEMAQQIMAQREFNTKYQYVREAIVKINRQINEH
jgi:hypothetical protein